MCGTVAFIIVLSVLSATAAQVLSGIIILSIRRLRQVASACMVQCLCVLFGVFDDCGDECGAVTVEEPCL